MASAMMSLLLPTLRRDDSKEFQSMYDSIVPCIDHRQGKTEAMTAATALFAYWQSGFDDQWLAGDFKAQWLRMARFLRMCLYERMGYILSWARDANSLVGTCFADRLESAGCLDKPLNKEGAYVPPEWGYGLSNFARMPVHILTWEDAELRRLEYKALEDQEDGLHWPPKSVAASNAATQIILYLRKFENKEYVPDNSNQVDHRAHKASHFFYIQPQDLKLGPCPQNIPWIEAWQKEMKVI
jgi:hypothetical protein